MCVCLCVCACAMLTASEFACGIRVEAACNVLLLKTLLDNLVGSNPLVALFLRLNMEGALDKACELHEANEKAKLLSLCAKRLAILCLGQGGACRAACIGEKE